MPKDSVEEFYLIPCKIINEHSVPRVHAYKYGVTNGQTAEDRLKSNKSDFKKFYRLKHQITDGKADIEVEFNLSYVLKGPRFFIYELEKIIGNEYFVHEERYFKHTAQNGSEFVMVTEESAHSFTRLLEILPKFEQRIQKLNEGYNQIDSNHDKVIENFKDSYNSVLEQIKSALKISPKTVTPNPIQVNQSVVIPRNNPVDYLLTDFKLFKKGNKYYLQHNIYHKGKNVTDYLGAFLVDKGNPNADKFQWAQNKQMMAIYSRGQISFNTALKTFKEANALVDLDQKNGSNDTQSSLTN